MLDTQPTALETVIQHFQHWRQTRVHQHEDTPVALQKMAVQLLATHRATDIMEALNINSRALKRWRQQNELNSCENAFVALPTPPTALNSGSQMSPVTLQLPNGMAIAFSDAVCMEQLARLIRCLLTKESGA